MTKKRWKQQTNMPEDSGRVVVYCKETEKEEWAEEAEEKGYRSRSSYLYELIQEARAYRQEGFLARENSQEKINQLENKVEHLKNQLENQGERPQQRGIDEEAVKESLTRQYQPLDQVLKQSVEEGLLDDFARKPVEDTLYELASKGEVEFERGYGWKITESDVGGR